MFEKKILLPHQYYYPHMELIADKSTVSKERQFFDTLRYESKSGDASIYVHIPFCDSKCAFCGFDKVKNTSEINQYKKRVYEEIDYYAEQKYIKDLQISVIHMGGGTPTILPRDVFNGILKRIKEKFNVNKDVIINIEGSATTIYKDEVIDYIKENHIRKVSVGVQTFNSKLREQYKSKATLDGKRQVSGCSQYVYPDTIQ